jgi:large subunit ribosomal protein L18
MTVKSKPRAARYRRHQRVRVKVIGTASRPRLCVFRSLNHIYAQVIDDAKGQTLAAASTLDTESKGEIDGKTKTGKAGLVGSLVAKRALSKSSSRGCPSGGTKILRS